MTDTLPDDLDATARIARDLIRFDTTNHGEGRSEGETEAAEYVEQHLKDLGLKPELIDAAPGRTSVLARIPGRNRDKPALVVHGHLDVVPADPANWSVDPFAGVIQEIITSGRAPERDLIMGFFSDEEAGGVLGSAYVVENRPDWFEGATEAISEVGGYSIDLAGKRAYLLQTGEKALVWIRLVATGTAGHGSQVNRDNAVTRLAGAVARIGMEEWPVHLTDTTRQLLDEIARIVGQDPTQVAPDDLAIATGTASKFIAATLRTTTNPTLLHAGYKHNVIPDTAEALVDIRVLPGEEEAVLERVRELAGEGVEVRVVHQDVGLENPFDGPLVDAMVATLGAHDPEAEVLPYMLSGGTDNKALSLLGITGYGFAPLKLPASMDFPAMFHGVDERVPLDALVFGRQVLRDLLLDY
jgi:acetylornithine deacetylase/succinyl-diaminopimelate desuccinylase-like protein